MGIDGPTIPSLSDIQILIRRHIDPDVRSPHAALDEVVRIDGATVERRTFSLVSGRSVSGYVVRPDGLSVRGAALVCAGRNANVSQVAGVEPPDHPDRALCVHLARQGLVALVLDPNLVSTLDPMVVRGRDELNLLALAASATGRSLLGLLAGEACEGLAWLADDTGTPERTIIVGHSLGSHVALHAAIAWRRPLPAALAAFACTYHHLLLHAAAAGGVHLLPGVLSAADLSDLIGAAALRAPVVVQHGNRDEIIAPCAARDAIGRAALRWPEADLHLHTHPGGHGVDLGALSVFVDRVLATTPPSEPVASMRIVFSSTARTQIAAEIDNVLGSGNLTLGRVGRALETEATRWTQTSDCVALSSGTAAVELALNLVGVAGRVVLVQANTFFATAASAIRAGADVRFVDTEPVGLGMCPAALQRALDETENVAAVVAVHIAGIVSPSLPALVACCDARGVPLIEDAAHALGSAFDGCAAGSFGAIGTFSLYPTKVVTSGEGGLLVARDPALLDSARRYRDQGKASFLSNEHDRLGNNWRMSELHAAVGRAHLRGFDAILAERAALAARYDALLAGAVHLRSHPRPPGVKTNFYKYVVWLDSEVDRDTLSARVRERHGVNLSGPVYDRPCSAQPYFAGRFPSHTLPTAHAFCAGHVCLPLYPTLAADEQERVASAVIEEASTLASLSRPHTSGKL